MGPVMMMVTDRRRTAGSLPERVGAAARAGVHLIQIREPDLEGGAYAALAAACVRASRGTGARVLTNDRADVAVAAGASGVHLRSDSVPPARARVLLPPPALIGQSVHDADEPEWSTAAGVLDYLVFGTVFSSASKPGRAPAEVKRLARLVTRTPLPVLAIGGVTVERMAELATSGAAGFAAISLFRDTPLEQLPDVIALAHETWPSAARR
jgi:thiamine-phosphate pyrophosphorylase